jgi:copper chaperone NosL
MTTHLDNNMKSSSRLLLAFASLSLLLLFVTPLWRITLDAPQYPEGIGMLIQIDNVTGVKKNDLKNINGLNHYIGMKTIVPESIPELKYMPWIIGTMIVLGLGAAASGKRWALYTWAGLFVVVAVIGLIDFYMWEYDYGHNLDLEHASIKIPGMSYQPPLIGSKKLLNFTANSWPDIGGWTAMISVAIGVVLSWLELRRTRRLRAAGQGSVAGRAAGKAAAPVAMAIALGATLLAGCATGPTPIHYGSDACEHCRMVIADPRYAVELVTETGKVLKFDAIECAAAHASSVPGELEAWVHLPSDLDTWIAAQNVRFRQSDEIRSPMGAGLAVAGPRNDDSAAAGISLGVVEGESDRLTWTQVVASFEKRDNRSVVQ